MPEHVKGDLQLYMS